MIKGDYHKNKENYFMFYQYHFIRIMRFLESIFNKLSQLFMYLNKETAVLESVFNVHYLKALEIR